MFGEEGNKYTPMEHEQRLSLSLLLFFRYLNLYLALKRVVVVLLLLLLRSESQKKAVAVELYMWRAELYYSARPKPEEKNYRGRIIGFFWRKSDFSSSYDYCRWCSGLDGFCNCSFLLHFSSSLPRRELKVLI